VSLCAAERLAQPPPGWRGAEPEIVTAELTERPESSALRMAYQPGAMAPPGMEVAAGPRSRGAAMLKRSGPTSRVAESGPAELPTRGDAAG
jgi:hypothetical protein